MQKIGVVLFNLGGPHNLAAVQPFLYNLFLDPNIFTFPLASLVRKPLARFISSRRAKKSSPYFEYMGGKSPIIDLTLDQARELERRLNKGPHTQFKVVVAMRYWYPLTQNALSILRREGIQKVILLPLYPHYSYTTTRSSEREWELQCKKMKMKFEEEKWVKDYHDHPLYIQSSAARIREGLGRFPEAVRSQVHLLFSAHGVPVKEIKAGDPYEDQILKSKELVLRELNLPNSHSLSYQSKVGPLKWLEPKTVRTLEKLILEQGKKYILAIPISFVSDHSETLYELKKLYGDMAKEWGGTQYELMPALNTQEKFIECLKDRVTALTI
ncbi:MAG: ferrochelatase [Deltaproteobacteria bacterium]|nr:ferrochelatase [Deltaproteobacteria bacterium]